MILKVAENKRLMGIVAVNQYMGMRYWNLALQPPSMSMVTYDKCRLSGSSANCGSTRMIPRDNINLFFKKTI
jgi:hypothetical protein